MVVPSIKNLTVTRGQGAYPVVLNRALCTGCGRCVSRCTTGALTLDNKGRAQLNGDLCLGLGGCVFVCPAAAIKFE